MNWQTFKVNPLPGSQLLVYIRSSGKTFFAKRNIDNEEDLIVIEPRGNSSHEFAFELEELKRNGKDNYFWSYITMPA